METAAAAGAWLSANAATVAAVSGTALTAAGTIGQAQYQKAMYQQQAQEAGYRTTYARQRADYEAQKNATATDKLISAQRVSLLKSGVDLTSPSAVAILGDTRYQSELDEALIRHDAELEAWGYGAQGARSTAAAKQASTAGYIGAGSSLLSSAGKWSTKK